MCFKFQFIKALFFELNLNSMYEKCNFGGCFGEKNRVVWVTCVVACQKQTDILSAFWIFTQQYQVLKHDQNKQHPFNDFYIIQIDQNQKIPFLAQMNRGYADGEIFF